MAGVTIEDLLRSFCLLTLCPATFNLASYVILNPPSNQAQYHFFGLFLYRLSLIVIVIEKTLRLGSEGSSNLSDGASHTIQPQGHQIQG